jgi:hypothetical protein
MHPDADQLSVFVEGAASAREHERMLAHLAECAECRKAVFFVQPHKEPHAATTTPGKGWIWRRLLPVALPAAALACALLAVLIYLRPRGAPAPLQQNARVRQPEIQLPETAVAPTNNSETIARSASPKNGVARNAAPNLSRQENRATAGSILPESKSHQTAPNVKPPQAMAAAPSVSMVAGSITPGVQSDLPLNGRNVTDLQQFQEAPRAQAAAAQNSVAGKKDQTALAIERKSDNSSLGGVSGRITDRSGATVAGATVTLRDASGKTRQTTTGADGSFHLTGLPAGKYELTATANGFQANKQTIDLKASELALLQPVLDVGAVSETVEVQARAAQSLQTESANVSDQSVAEISGAGRVSPLPSSLPVAATVSHGKRFLSLDSAGNLFLSRNRGKKWKKIDPQWTGKAVWIDLAPPTIAGAIFQLNTDADVVWTSKDGAHWHQQQPFKTP